jgi:serine/threonine protein kinase
LGQGSQASVVKARNLFADNFTQVSHDVVAIKSIPLLDDSSQNNDHDTHIQHEIESHWRLLKCPGAVQLIEIFMDQDYAYLVLEYLSLGNLREQLGASIRGMFSEQQIKIIMQ